MTATIYHNPRCSKSRETLALLEKHGVAVQVVEYLKAPPSKKELAHILNLLGIPPRGLIRTSEATYKEHDVGNSALTDTQLITLMVTYPVLIERPIVIINGKACIGRPPENVLSILA